MICQRCKKQTIVTIMSMFNTDIICMDCEDKEKNHPDYEKAVAAEMASVRRGDVNFSGIGKPVDL